MVPSCFLTPIDGLREPERSHFQQHKFPSLFINVNLLLAMNSILPRSTKSFKVVPYDLYNPSVQSQLLDQICIMFYLYFASNVVLKNHIIIRAHEKEKTPITVNT